MAEYNPELVSAVSNILRDILGPDCSIDYYVDYRESGALNSAEDIEAVAKYLDEANGDVKLAANYAYYDTHMDAVSDIEMYLENDLVKQVEDALADYDSEHGTELLDELQAIGWDYDFYEQCGYKGVNIPADEFYPSTVCLEIRLATYEEANHEGYILDFFGGYYPHESNMDDPEMRDNMLVEFMQSQGLEPEDVNDESKSGKVLDSVRAELANISSHIDFLTVCASFSLADAARLLSNDFNSITINPGSTMGIFDSWSGGGSIFEIAIETPWTVPADKVERVKLSNSSSGGYSVADVYGISSDDTGFYCETVTVN